MILKPNMAISGKKCSKQAPSRKVGREDRAAVEGLRAARRWPGIAFLSGGQSDEEATAHLNAMHRLGTLPWPADLLLWPRAAGGAAKGLGGQGRECRGRPAGLRPSRAHECAGGAQANGKPAWKRRWHRLAAKPAPPRPTPRLYLATARRGRSAKALAASLPGLLPGPISPPCCCGCSRPIPRTMTQARQGLGARDPERGRGAAAGRPCRTGRPRGRRRRAHERHQGARGGAADLEARPHRGCRRAGHPARFHGGRRNSARTMCCSANRTRKASGHRRMRSPNGLAMVGPRLFRAALHRLSPPRAREALRIYIGRGGFRAGRRPGVGPIRRGAAAALADIGQTVRQAYAETAAQLPKAAQGSSGDMTILRPISISVLVGRTCARQQRLSTISLTPSVAAEPPRGGRSRPPSRRQSRRPPPRSPHPPPPTASKPSLRRPRRRLRRHQRRTIPMSIWSTAPISAGNTRPPVSNLAITRAAGWRSQGDDDARGALFPTRSASSATMRKAGRLVHSAPPMPATARRCSRWRLMRIAGRGGPLDKQEGRQAAGLLGQARRTQGCV